MQLRTKPFPWGCLATSFAMALDQPVSFLINNIGHDGSKIVWPHLPEPMRRQGHHPQECILVAIALGHSVTPVELAPVLANSCGAAHPLPARWAWFTSMIQRTKGVITGMGRRSGHAVAYERGTIFDPDGFTYPYSREACERRGFFTQCLWIVI